VIVSSDSARRRQWGKSERLLSVGNPVFDRSAFPLLRDLPSARKEAESIAQYYGAHQILCGEKATKIKVRAEMEKSDIIHLALHSVGDSDSALRSKLILAKDSEGNEAGGTIQAYEIYRLRLASARLVVLSGCTTGIERYLGGEGMMGISRSFIARGVPIVVASLWPVDSESTAELMISFHRHRRVDHVATAEALRCAQLETMSAQSGRYRRPYYWASFVAIGGYTEF